MSEKVKIWADSLDKSFDNPNESFLFCKDLVEFDDSFELASSANNSDCIVIPQYSNNYINNLIGNYVFDKEKADELFNSGKLIVIVNTGGGCPYEWEKLPIWEYIQSGLAKKLTIFSTECYSWHRDFFKHPITYLPFDYVGFVDFGLGLRPIPPLQTKEQYLNRALGTAVAFNSYPPTRDKIWELVHEQNRWKHFTYQTTIDNQKRIDWNIMAANLLNSKIGFAPDGATAKTERHLFTPAYTVMMIQEDAYLEFPFEWTDGVNCLQMEHDFIKGLVREKELEYEQNGHHLRVLNKERTTKKITEWLDKPNELYEVYVNGWRNDENYRIPNYLKNYIGKKIKENL